MTKVESPADPASSDRPRGHKGKVIALAAGAAVVVALVVTALVLSGTSSGSTNAGNAQNLSVGGLPTPDPNSPPPPSATPIAGSTVAPPKVDARYGVAVSQTVGKNVDAKLSGGMTAKVVSIEAFDAKASRAGETAGPALKVTIALSNSTGRDVTLAQVAVNSYYGSKSTPAVALTDGAKPLLGSLADGATATGVFIFSVPSDQQKAAVITMTDSAGAPVTVFK